MTEIPLVPQAAEPPSKVQYAAAGATIGILTGLVLLAAPVASHHIRGGDAAGVALVGGDLVMDLVIAMLLYSRGRIAGDADSVALGHLFLFSGGFFVVRGLAAVGAIFGPGIAVERDTDGILWLIWTGGWLAGIARHVWTTDLAAVRQPIKRQVARAAVVTLLAALATWAATLLLREIGGTGWAPPSLLPAVMLAVGLLAVVGCLGVARRLARQSIGGLWLAVILMVQVMDVGLRALGDGPDTIGRYAGTSALLLVKLAAFASLFGVLVFRFMRISETNSALDVLAYHDALTSLANRRRFDELFLMEWRRCGRDRVPLALVLMDVDKFKQFNDGYGHPAGDECLATVAAVLADNVRRPGDLAARYGGEEFALLLPGADAEGAVHLAEQICLALREMGIPHDASHVGVVTMSAGVACLVPMGHERNAARLLKAADQALYQAKQAGRDQVAIAVQPAEQPAAVR